MANISEQEAELLLDDYCQLEVGGHTTVSYSAETRWVEVNAELARRGLVPMRDYVLQKAEEAAYPGLVTYSLARLTGKEPQLATHEKTPKGFRSNRRGPAARYDDQLADAITDLLLGRTQQLELSTGWTGAKRDYAYGATLHVLTTLSGNS